MDVILLRHAIAEDPASFKRSGMADSMRPLTVEGRRKMRRGAEGLRRIVAKVDLIAASPLVRAIETAHIVAKAYDKPRVAELKDLSPGGDLEALFKFMVQHRKETIAIVGHEPDLGRLACAALGCRTEDRMPLKKGGCVMLHFDGPVGPGRAVLKFALPPQLLRRLAK